MSDDTINTYLTYIGDEPVKVSVKGLGRAARALRQAGADMGDMSDLMHEIGMIVVRAAMPRAPYVTGRLDGTIRAGRGKTKAVVRAGGRRAPYAGVIHYGWPERHIAPHPFMVDAVRSTQPYIFDAFEKGLTQILRKHDLT